MKVCLYARVSMDEGAEDKRYQEPENQLGPLRAWAAALGWPVVCEYIDKASGGDSGRPEFRRMLDDARIRKFDVILIWKLDRFSRERMLNTVSYINELRRWGVGVKSQTESWLDTCQDNPIADVVLAIMAWAASEERRKISDRTKAGIARRRAIGQWKGGRPKTLPPLQTVCIQREDGIYCLHCDKRFLDEKDFSRNWNAHTKSHRHIYEGKEKGGAVNGTPETELRKSDV